MKKLTLLSLLVCILILSLSSCSNENSAEMDNGTASNETSTEENVETEPEETVLSATDQIKEKYSEADLGDQTFTIIAPDSSAHWIYSGIFNEVQAEEYTGEVVNDRLFERNKMTEEILNVNLEFSMQNSIGLIETIVANNVIAGDKSYDIALTTMTGQANNMMKGNLINVHTMENLELSNPWWEKNQIDTFTIQNKLYWLCGDINIGDDYAVQVLYFNKTMCGSFNLESPYQAIEDGTWTLEKMFKMTETVSDDTDGDGEMTLNDRWGVVDANYHMMHWLYAAGQRIVEVGDNGTLRLCILDENHINAIDTLYSYFVDRSMMYPGNVNNDVSCFTTGHTLFFSNQLYTLELLREMDDDFGIIPMPKLDENQETYGAFISHGGGTAFAVPITNDRLDDTGTLLEVMCGLSTDTLRSAFYDVLFSSKLVRDNESVASLDTIFASKTYDWGVDFSWASSIANIYANIVTDQSNQLVSSAKKLEKSLNKGLERVTETIISLP